MSYLSVKGELNEIQEEKLVEWKISDFSLLPKNKGFRYHSPTFNFANDYWQLNIYPRGDVKAKDGFISLFLEKDTETSCNVTCTFGLKKTDGKLIRESTFTQKFISVGVGYKNFFQRSELLRKESGLSPSDVLTIVCHMKLGTEEAVRFTDHSIRITGEFCKRQDVDATSQTEKYEEEKGCNFCQNLKKMLLDGSDHDLILKVGDKEFRAHQNILRSRSEVFNSMLRHDMIEKVSGVIDVPDCDPQAFEQFLVYMYSGEVETLDPTNMLELYYIADKYDMTHLKEKCREFITRSPSFTNICDIIQLSLNHSDSNLLDCATNYFVNNMKDILPTVEWQHFLKNHLTQANELLIKSANKWCNPKV